MRYVMALFDAPRPAQAAIDALLSEGFAAGDISVIPGPNPVAPGHATEARPRPLGDGLTGERRALQAALEEHGVPRVDAEGYAEGVRRGGLLVVVRCPTISTPQAVAVMNAVGALDLAEHRQLWQAAAADRDGARGDRG